MRIVGPQAPSSLMVAFGLAISQPPFWLAAFAATLALNVVLHPGLRKTCWAAINLGFLSFLIEEQVFYVIAGVAVVWAALKWIHLVRFRWPVLLVLGGAILFLFLANKIQIRTIDLHFPEARHLLAAIGFSYVSLRLVEVVRAVSENRHAPPDPLSLINYLLPFHMLAAGPIQSFEEFARQPPVPKAPDRLGVFQATERLAFGLFKKFVLATTIDSVFLTDFANPGLYTVLEAQLFFLWLYLDFSAYTDIAVGLGRLMGVATPENFNRPYLARNMIDFWERWHISLSLFIRRHIYIPIFATLTRRSPTSDPLALSAVAFIVAFVLCGLWHDVSLNFFLWGAAHAFGLVVTNVYHHELRRRLSTKQWKAYLANPVIRGIAVVVTYEFVALSLLLLFFPR